MPAWWIFLKGGRYANPESGSLLLFPVQSYFASQHGNPGPCRHIQPVHYYGSWHDQLVLAGEVNGIQGTVGAGGEADVP